jgi:hypothetical protein
MGLHLIPRIPFLLPVIGVQLDLSVLGGSLLGKFLELLQSNVSFALV